MLMFHTKSIRTKLILGCILLSMIPIFIITSVLYRVSINTINQNTAENIMDNLENYSERMDKLFLDIYYKTVEYSFDPALGESILQEDGQKIIQYLKSNKSSNRYIDSIYLYLNSNNILYRTDSKDYVYNYANQENSQDYIENKESYPIVIKEGIDPLSNHYTFSIIRNIYNKNTGESLGYVQVNVYERTLFYELLYGMTKRSGGEIIMMNTRNQIASAEDGSRIGEVLEGEVAGPYLQLPRGYSIIQEDEPVLKAYAVNEITKYKLIYYIPEKHIIHDVKRIKYVVLLCSIFSFIAIIILWYNYTRDIYDPIVKLKNYMLKVGDGDFNIHLEHNRKDEIGFLMDGFNDMNENINYLFNEVYSIKYQKKEAELKALQAQITPHFLYNTLNSIRCMALIQKDHVVSNMLDNLIELLRATAGTKEIFITLEEEIKQVKNYVEILNFRYNNAFIMEYTMDAKLEDCIIPKLIIQPLVENSIQHGIDLPSKKGKITVHAYEENENLMIEVLDNGKGISEEEIEKILSRTSTSKSFNGIGVQNVDERVQLYYGQVYGLSYHKGINGGTKALITLPLNKEVPEDV